jgi:hypothetical protein
MMTLSRAFFAGVTIAGLIGYLTISRAQTSEKRFFTVAAVEPRGGVNVAQELFPTQPLPQGGGYVIRARDQTGRWEVSTYVWMPSQIVSRRAITSRWSSSASTGHLIPPRSEVWARRFS